MPGRSIEFPAVVSWELDDISHLYEILSVIWIWIPLPASLMRPASGGDTLDMIVVLFGTELRPDIDRAEYEARNRRLDDLVRHMPGFISVQSYTSTVGGRVTIARFESEAALDAWRRQPEHVEAQRNGREKYYDSYWVQVCETIREYDFRQAGPHDLT